MGRTREITEYIKSFDDKLFCDKNAEGKLCIYRKDYTYERYEYEGSTIDFLRPAPYLVFALTDNWTINGKPVDRGLLPIYFRLQQIDLWNRDIAKESIESIERAKNSNERAVDNHFQSFLSENRREFGRITNDIRTANLNTEIKIGD